MSVSVSCFCEREVCRLPKMHTKEESKSRVLRICRLRGCLTSGRVGRTPLASTAKYSTPFSHWEVHKRTDLSPAAAQHSHFCCTFTTHAHTRNMAPNMPAHVQTSAHWNQMRRRFLLRLPEAKGRIHSLLLRSSLQRSLKAALQLLCVQPPNTYMDWLES